MFDASADAPSVLAEIQAGECLTLSAAGRLFPGHKGGKAVDPSTVFRWVTKGSRATDGTCVKLEAIRVGSRWLTSASSIKRYVAALTTINTDSTEEIRTPAERNKASEKAAAKLREMGA